MTSIARSYPDPLGAGRIVAHAGPARPAAAFVGAFALACFAPYPALSIGSSNGLQLSQALTLAAVPVLVRRVPGRPLLALIALLAPAFVSAALNATRGSTPEPDVLLKEATSLTLALMVLWPASWLSGPAHFRRALLAAAVGITAHAVIGLYQVYAFRNDVFPLLWLYRNPSFKDMYSWSDIYAMYIKRPCGLFPEPSAMASALGPWLVLLAGQLAGGLPGMRVTGRRRGLAIWAVAGGLVLLVLSRSGSSVAVLLGVVVAVLGGTGRAVRGARTAAALAGVVGLFVMALLVFQFSDGFSERVESSWGFRAQSIVTALTASTGATDLIIGVGPGQSTPIVRRALSGMPRPKDQDDLAVFSLAASYYMENGLLGALALLGVLGAAVLAIGRSSARAAGLGALFAWLVGVTVTTSYLALSPVWLFLGAALVWDQVFPPSLVPRGAPI